MLILKKWNEMGFLTHLRCDKALCFMKLDPFRPIFHFSPPPYKGREMEWD
jgi:hypothetical protein